MVLDDADLLDDGDGGGKASAVSCSICLDVVTDNGSRSRAKLQCGHEFHLDCIGSAFNVKGAMQCPNCRKIEKGQWLYANGSRPLPEFNMDDWAHDEDLYDLSYSEMSFGVHWCPFSGLTRLPSSFDETEFTPSSYHDLIGQHTIFTEHTTALSSATNPCPYIAYIGPVHPSSSNSNASVSSDGSNINNPWNNHQSSTPNEIQPNSYAFPSIDAHYHSWEQHHYPSANFSTTSSRISNATDQQPIPSIMTQRTPRPSDIQRSGSYVHPFIVGHSSGGRAGSPVTSSMIPPYPGSAARTRDRVQALQAYFQQPTNNSPPHMRTPNRRPNPAHRGLPQAAPLAQADQPNGFYFFPSSSRNFSEPENPSHQSRFHIRDPAMPGQVDPAWGPFHHPAGYRPRHGGSERSMQSHNRPS